MIDITLEVDVSDELFFRIHVPVSKGILWSFKSLNVKNKNYKQYDSLIDRKMHIFSWGNGGGGGVMIINDLVFQSCTFLCTILKCFCKIMSSLTSTCNGCCSGCKKN